MDFAGDKGRRHAGSAGRRRHGPTPTYGRPNAHQRGHGHAGGRQFFSPVYPGSRKKSRLPDFGGDGWATGLRVVDQATCRPSVIQPSFTQLNWNNRIQHWEIPLFVQKVQQKALQSTRPSKLVCVLLKCDRVYCD
jgi:hypothetical protein